MKKLKTSRRTVNQALRISTLFGCLAIYSLIWTSSLTASIGSDLSRAAQAPQSLPRQVAHLRLDKTFNSTGFLTDRYAKGNDSVAGALLLPDGRMLVGVNSDVWNGPFYFSGFEITRINADGTKDLTFGKECSRRNTTGVFSAYSPVDFYQQRFSVQPDDKIIAA